jgi:hypothetical protein
VIRVEQDGADLLADAGAAGVADEDDPVGAVVRLEALVQHPRLGALAAALGAVEDDERAARGIHPPGS